jgi:glycosyltransferase involved in cell wall biosynthesis
VRLGVAPPERFRAVPLGLELQPFAAANSKMGRELRSEVGMGDEEVLLTFVGRVVPIKRVDRLLRSVSLARAQGAQVRLAIVGDGEIRPSLETLARDLGIRKSVHFLGYRRDLPRICAATDIAVITSENEGTPVSLIEAAAAGCPAIATAVGGVGEVVTPDTGILIPPGDERALAGTITQLAANPELRWHLGERARDRALGCYSIERLITDIEVLYEELRRQPRVPSSEASSGAQRL